MVDTIKFSEFANAGNLDNTSTTVGLSSGANSYFENPWTFLPPGTTDERPIVPDSSINYRLRFNTTLAEYEYYDPTFNAWIPLSTTYNDSVACYAASTVNLTVTQLGSGVGATLTNSGTQAVFTLDGTTPPLNSRVLIKNQSTSTQNGIYTVAYIGSSTSNWVLLRATDYDTPLEINSTGIIPVVNGTTNSQTGWLNTSIVITVDVTPIIYVIFASVTYPIPLNKGGTGADLTAVDGGIVYSTGSSLAISAAGTTGQILVSQGVAEPIWSNFPFTSTMKNGSGAGNYSTSSSSFVDVDSSNLSYTVTVPVGYKILINTCYSWTNSSGSAEVVICISVDGASVIENLNNQPTDTSTANGGALTYIFNGDGASHTFELKWKTDAGTALMFNGTSVRTPCMTFLMLPSS